MAARVSGGHLRMLRLAVILGMVVALYAPFLGGGPLTDDFAHLERLAYLPLADVVSTPDVFGYFRPLTQASLKLEMTAHGQSARGFRIVSLVLHVAVIAAAYLVALMVLPSPTAAAMATTAFALTPKAHPTAVLWISARGDLLMVLFALAATAAWIRWTRGGRAQWLAAAIACYGLAVLSKEAAFLLPLALCVTPAPTREARSRLLGIAVMLVVAAVLLLWRVSTGAVMPAPAAGGVALMVLLGRVARNAFNYLGRLSPAPSAFAISLGAAVAWTIGLRRIQPHDVPQLRDSLVFAFAWTIALLAPVLPITLRSELYLYAPELGACLAAGAAIGALVQGEQWPRAASIALAVCVAGLGAYQMSRSAAWHADALFSERLTDALQHDSYLNSQSGVLSIVPRDGDTAKFMQDAVGGYTDVFLQHVFGPGRFVGAPANASGPPAGITVGCTYRGGHVLLRGRTP